jgi:uncharacterized protein (DUF2062 family)
LQDDDDNFDVSCSQVITKDKDSRHTWIGRHLIHPVIRMLRQGASPQQLAWSLAAGLVIGMNPLFGSSTVATIAITHLLRLNHSASQVGVHSSYPIQIALFLPFMHAGTVLFGTDPLPLGKHELMGLMHEHPLQLVRSLWMWEWHALVVWLAFAAVLTPAIAMLLSRVLERAMRHPRVAEC